MVGSILGNSYTLWMYLCGAAVTIYSVTCSRASGLVLTAYTALRLSRPEGWSSSRVSVFRFVTMGTSGTRHNFFDGGIAIQ